MTPKKEKLAKTKGNREGATCKINDNARNLNRSTATQQGVHADQGVQEIATNLIHVGEPEGVVCF